MSHGPFYGDLKITCYKFILRVTHTITLPTFSGSTFHGGFGHALNRIGKRYRDYFFRSRLAEGNAANRTPPKPFALIPPAEGKARYVPGETMQCGIFLFGEATRHFMIVFGAMKILGRELGLGRDEGRFSIDYIEQFTLDGPVTLLAKGTWYSIPEPVSSRDVLHAHRIVADGVKLSLITRMRLQHDDRYVREPPPFNILFNRLIGRINSLATFYGGQMLMPPPEKHQMLKAAQRVETNSSGTTARWVDWHRPSKPGKDKMSFGGLMGTLEYAGEVSPFIPWLALGQWTAVGGKTSFGLGLYDLNWNGEMSHDYP